MNRIYLFILNVYSHLLNAVLEMCRLSKHIQSQKYITILEQLVFQEATRTDLDFQIIDFRFFKGFFADCTPFIQIFLHAKESRRASSVLFQLLSYFQKLCDPDFAECSLVFETVLNVFSSMNNSIELFNSTGTRKDSPEFELLISICIKSWPILLAILSQLLEGERFSADKLFVKGYYLGLSICNHLGLETEKETFLNSIVVLARKNVSNASSNSIIQRYRCMSIVVLAQVLFTSGNFLSFQSWTTVLGLFLRLQSNFQFLESTLELRLALENVATFLDSTSLNDFIRASLEILKSEVQKLQFNQNPDLSSIEQSLSVVIKATSTCIIGIRAHNLDSNFDEILKNVFSVFGSIASQGRSDFLQAQLVDALSEISESFYFSENKILNSVIIFFLF